MLMVGQATLMVSAYCFAPVQPFASVALTVKLNWPPAVGVPLAMPVVDNVTPFGNAPALMK